MLFLKKMISKNKIKDVFEILENSLLYLDYDIFNLLISIIADYRLIQKNKLKGILSIDLQDRRYAENRDKLITLIDQIESDYKGKIVSLAYHPKNKNFISTILSNLQGAIYPFPISTIEDGEELTSEHLKSIAFFILASTPENELIYPKKILELISYEKSIDDNTVFALFKNGIIEDPRSVPYTLQTLEGFDLRSKSVYKKVGQQIANVQGKKSNSGEGSHPLHDFPKGPMVEFYLISRELKTAYANYIPVTDARQVISEAIAFRKQADPDDKSASTIKHYDLPAPEVVGSYLYWQDVFNEACLHGPRMLAAILLLIPPNVFNNKIKKEREALLEKLKSWEGED